jgi:4-hydroxybenzoate polyprenyltransferase
VTAPPSGTREGQTFAGESPVVRWANFVKLPHTVFALPFAIVGLVQASYVAAVSWRQVAWIVVAFTAARFAAMAFNRIVDRDLDSRNPRTRGREIPRGAIGVTEAKVAVVVASALFVFAASRLNALCLALSPLALATVLLYSYTKRFTAWSHVVLGVGLGIAPVGGYLAIAGTWPEAWWGLVAIAGAVTAWVAGFDVLYALQDVDFDRREGLRSIPARLGIPGAIRIARVLHATSVVLLACAGLALAGGTGWLVGVACVAAMLLWEHRLVRSDDLSKLDAAFFTMNGVISLMFCAIVLARRFMA